MSELQRRSARERLEDRPLRWIRRVVTGAVVKYRDRCLIVQHIQEGDVVGAIAVETARDANLHESLENHGHHVIGEFREDEDLSIPAAVRAHRACEAYAKQWLQGQIDKRTSEIVRCDCGEIDAEFEDDSAVDGVPV